MPHGGARASPSRPSVVLDTPRSIGRTGDHQRPTRGRPMADPPFGRRGGSGAGPSRSRPRPVSGPPPRQGVGPRRRRRPFPRYHDEPLAIKPARSCGRTGTVYVARKLRAGPDARERDSGAERATTTALTVTDRPRSERTTVGSGGLRPRGSPPSAPPYTTGRRLLAQQFPNGSIRSGGSRSTHRTRAPGLHHSVCLAHSMLWK